MNDQIIIEKTQGNCRTLQLHRPECLNALSLDLAQALNQAIASAAQDKSIRVLVIRGSDKAFSAGGDIKYMKKHRQDSEQIFKDISKNLNEMIENITRMPKPVIAAIEGPAYAAGFGIALACDILVAKAGAKFSPSFVNIGIAPNAATTYFLPRIIGPKRAAEAFFRGQAFSAREAEALGIVNHVWDAQSFESELEQLIQDLSQRPTLSLGRMKKLLRSTYQLEFSAQLAAEREEIASSSLGGDFEEGISAFVEKRRAQFRGK